MSKKRICREAGIGLRGGTEDTTRVNPVKRAIKPRFDFSGERFTIALTLVYKIRELCASSAREMKGALSPSGLEEGGETRLGLGDGGRLPRLPSLLPSSVLASLLPSFTCNHSSGSLQPDLLTMRWTLLDSTDQLALQGAGP